jgi:simple sugar transport system ATP-binding protein
MTATPDSAHGSAPDSAHDSALRSAARPAPILEVREIGKSYGPVRALHGVSATVDAGEVLCVLGDNGAGKSTLIKIFAGVHPHTEGELLAHGRPARFSNPRAALDLGITTVYQDLAVVPLMPVWRNFFLGAELTVGPLRRLDITRMRQLAHAELARMGIRLRDIDQPIGTLSGGERQSVAIARAVYFGASVVILDEPTAALGVKQSGVVLRYVAQARDRGLGVVFITHNPHHAYPVGDRFLLLAHGTSLGLFAKAQITLPEMTALMAGGAELEALAHELERPAPHTPDA